MRRRSRAGEPGNTRRRKTVKRQNASKPVRRSISPTAGQETEVARLTRELNEAREHQVATADVLKLISHSAFDLQTVLDMLVETAAQLCQAEMAMVFRREADAYRMVANYGFPPEFERFMRSRPLTADRGTIGGRVALEGKVVHVADVAVDPEYRLPEAVRLASQRSTLGVPLLREGKSVGVIVLARTRVEPYSEQQIELVRTFADQAVIAIENTRLLNELRQRTTDLTESLEQQTATSEVLSVISSSPGELELVFRAMLERATRVCGANFGVLFRYEGGQFHSAASLDVPPAFADFLRREGSFAPKPGQLFGRLCQSKAVIHIVDRATEPNPSPSFKYGGARSSIAVPMLKENELVGAFFIYRTEVRPFTDKQIELVKNFAAQAVIAIENARLLNELRQRTTDLTESLEQQTATSEVLKVISSSPGELQPVFEAILANATLICEAELGMLWRTEGDGFRAAALHGVPPELAGLRQREKVFHLDPEIPLGRVAQTHQLAHILNATTESAYLKGLEPFKEFVDIFGARTFVLVPMLKDDVLAGVIAIYRKEVRLFTKKQMELVQNFAAQGVIAIENTRLLNELRERTHELGASLDNLRVISSSPSELTPVFESMLANATRLCEANFGTLNLYKDGAFPVAAMHGVPAAYAEFRRLNPQFRVVDRHPLARVAATGQVQQIFDMQLEPLYLEKDPSFVAMVERAGARTLFLVPMLKDNDVIGVITIFRQEVQPFTDKQIALVQNFAAQAVIAIENARLLNELRESLDRQTATADILRVIAGTPEDSKRALDTIAETAVRMFDAANVNFLRFEGDVLRFVSAAGPAVAKLREALPDIPLEPTNPAVRSILDNRQIPIEDRRAVLPNEPGEVARILRDLPVRSQAFTPLSRQGKAIGVMIVTRSEVRPFQQGELDLMTGFADQAVIAIENTRLLNELRESLQQQTATADVLKIISRSTFDLKAVLNTLVESAARLCE